jgi:exonuclease III
MDANYNEIRLAKFYAPSGTARRRAREIFYKSELPELLETPYNSLIIGGDFNGVFQPADKKGQYTTSRTLSEIVCVLNFTDAWQQDPQRPIFTDHSPSGNTSLDRFYATPSYWDAKRVSKSSPPPSPSTRRSTSAYSYPPGKRGRGAVGRGRILDSSSKYN